MTEYKAACVAATLASFSATYKESETVLALYRRAEELAPSKTALAKRQRITKKHADFFEMCRREHW